MFRLSNLVTALFGIIAALGAILGITSLGSVNRVATDPNEPSLPSTAPANSISPSDGTVSLNPPGSATRQVGQNAASTGTPVVTENSTTTAQNPPAAQNPSAEFAVQGEGAVLTTEPTPPTTPSEAVAVQLDPSPGVAPATVSAQPPVAQAPETAAAPAPTPVRAMW